MQGHGDLSSSSLEGVGGSVRITNANGMFFIWVDSTERMLWGAWEGRQWDLGPGVMQSKTCLIWETEMLCCDVTSGKGQASGRQMANTLMLKHPGGWAQGVSYLLACSYLAAQIMRHVLWVGESCKDCTLLTSPMNSCIRLDFFLQRQE